MDVRIENALTNLGCLVVVALIAWVVWWEFNPPPEGKRSTAERLGCGHDDCPHDCRSRYEEWEAQSEQPGPN